MATSDPVLFKTKKFYRFNKNFLFDIQIKHKLTNLFFPLNTLTIYLAFLNVKSCVNIEEEEKI